MLNGDSGPRIVRAPKHVPSVPKHEQDNETIPHHNTAELFALVQTIKPLVVTLQAAQVRISLIHAHHLKSSIN